MGEYVYALYDEHVVSASLYAVYAAVSASARALLRDDACEVSCAVTQYRHHRAVERGEHHFAVFAVGNGLKCVWVDYLHDIVVFPQVHAVLPLALEGDARAVHLGHSETVVCLYAEHPFNAAALLVGVRLGSNE